MILIIDNYDSFTYNLLQLAGSFDPDTRVVRNDRISVDEIIGMYPSHLIISPGPGHPKDAGICRNWSRIKGLHLYWHMPDTRSSARLRRGDRPAKQPVHGKQRETILRTEPDIQGPAAGDKGRKVPFTGGQEVGLPEDLLVIAEDSEEEIMVLSTGIMKYTASSSIESILTPHGAPQENFENRGGRE